MLLLNQNCRTTISRVNAKHLVACISDYAVDYNLIMENAPRVLDIVSKPARNTYDKLLSSLGSNEFTLVDACQVLHMPEGTVKRHIQDLEKAGCIECVRKEGKAFVYKLIDDLPPLHELKLVDPASLAQTNE